MNTNQQVSALELQQLLQQKLDELSLAEEEGKPQQEILSIYRELEKASI